MEREKTTKRNAMLLEDFNSGMKFAEICNKYYITPQRARVILKSLGVTEIGSINLDFYDPIVKTTAIIDRNSLIIQKYADGAYISDISREFNLSPTHIRYILRIGRVEMRSDKRGMNSEIVERRQKRKDEILLALQNGISPSQVARDWGVSRERVRQVMIQVGVYDFYRAVYEQKCKKRCVVCGEVFEGNGRRCKKHALNIVKFTEGMTCADCGKVIPHGGAKRGDLCVYCWEKRGGKYTCEICGASSVRSICRTCYNRARSRVLNGCTPEKWTGVINREKELEVYSRLLNTDWGKRAQNKISIRPGGEREAMV